MSPEKFRFIKIGISFFLVIFLVYLIISLLISFVSFIDPATWIRALVLIVGSLVPSYAGLTIWIDRWFKRKNRFSHLE